MENTLNELLEHNEKVLWFGRVEKSRLLDAPDRRRQIALWCVAAVFLIATVAFVLPYMAGIGRPAQVLAIAFVVINFVPLLLASRPALDKMLLEGKTLYAVTDRRVIAVVKSNVYVLPLEGLEFAITGRSGTCGNIRFGAAVGSDSPDDRADAVLGIQDQRQVTGLVFYHIADVDTVAGLLRSEERPAA